MVAAFSSRNDTALRSAVETNFKKTLEATGYPAVSSLAEFGMTGLRELDQEDTYKLLSEKGIDAVITLVPVDRTDENYTEPKSSYTQPVKYYYERIWHYKERQGQFTDAGFDSSMKYSWEMILFDLSTLQPHYILQTRVYTNGIQESIQQEFWKDVIKRLRKDRFLKKREPVQKS